VSSQVPTPDPDRPPRGELALSLWVIAILLAVIEVTWLWADRIYSS
jgi:hypothetical protein